jgi:transposase-like protein
MTNESYYTLFEEIIEDLQGGGKDSLTKTISTLMNVAMKIEQEKALQASPYERNEERTGQRNGYKDKTLKTRVGEIPVQIPQVRGMEFYPGAIDKGDRSERALKLAIAQMYIQGVSTRRVSKIVEVLCGFEVSQAQVSDAAKLLDVEIEKWRNRPLGAFRYLVLDATYEKVRLEQAVVSGAVLIAYGVDNNGKRRVLGISTEISEAEVHWRAFLKSLVDRGLHGVEMITSDAHEGLKAARTAIFPTVKWQRCQFHLQQNAKHNKDFETDSPIVTVLASAAPARTRANYGSRLKSLLYGHFYFPIGGRIKLHEDSLIAAQRELYEEIGIHVPDLEYIGIIENFFFHQELHYHEINFVYQVHLSEVPDLPAEIEIIDHDQLSNIDLRPMKIKDIVNGNITLPFHLTIRD